MRILIINPPRYDNSSVTREQRCELIMNYRVDTPATLLIIASLLREKNYQIKFIDANGININYEMLSNLLKTRNFDCLIFTFNSQIIDYDLELCNIIKELNPKCITIGYSWYGRNYGKEIIREYKNLDILMIDDPFSIIEDLIDCISNNNDLSNLRGIVFRDKNNLPIVTEDLNKRKKINDLPLPAYDLLKSFKPYYIYSPFFGPYALVYAGKGCPFGCTYCPAANTKYSGKSGEKIIEELRLLKSLANVKYIWFFDEIFTINRKRTIKICKNLIEGNLKIKWFCDSRVDLVDMDLLKLMRKAGCIGISYGVETGSEKILKLMNKNISLEKAKQTLKLTRKANIPVQLNLLLGYIGETYKTLKETEIFIRETIPDFVQVSVLQPLENTKFVKIAMENNWIIEDLDWKKKLTRPHRKLINYEPYDLDLWQVRENFMKMLRFYPKWWFYSLKTLIRNLRLLLPVFYTFLKKSESISLI